MKISSSWEVFHRRLEKVYPAFNEQLLLDFDDDEDDS
jgi:hypothetical protein